MAGGFAVVIVFVQIIGEEGAKGRPNTALESISDSCQFVGTLLLDEQLYRLFIESISELQTVCTPVCTSQLLAADGFELC
jgi:hypothetical protein